VRILNVCRLIDASKFSRSFLERRLNGVICWNGKVVGEGGFVFWVPGSIPSKGKQI